jgi:two-component system, sensor histidine kinase PdtaS
MDVYYLLSVVAFLFYLQFGVYVVIKNPPSAVNLCLLVLSLFMALWSLAVIFIGIAEAGTGPVHFPPLSLLAWTVLPFFLFRIHLQLIRFPRNKRLRTWLSVLAGLVSLTLLVCYTLHANDVMQMIHVPDIPYPVPRLLYTMQMGYVLVVSLAVFAMIFRDRKRIEREKSTTSVRVFFYSFAVFLLLAVFFDLFNLPVGVEVQRSYTHLFAMLWLVAFTYAVVGKQLYLFNPGASSRVVINKVQKILFLCDANGFIIDSNDYTARLLQISLSRLSASRLIDFCSGRQELIREAFTEAFDKGESGPLVLRMKSFRGELIDTRLSFFRMHDDYEDLQGVMVSGIDLRPEQDLLKDTKACLTRVAELNIKKKTLEQRLISCTQEVNELEQEYLKICEKRSGIENMIEEGTMAKEVLVSEIYNRVKGNMNMISGLIHLLKSEHISKEKEQKLNMLSQRMECILLLHESIYLSLTHPEIDFRQFLELLENKIKQNLSLSFSIVKKIDSEYIPMDHAIALGLVANELILNALLHGFPPEHLSKIMHGQAVVQIEYWESDGRGYLTVRDNGVGISSKLNIKKLSTHGLPLATMLINEQLDGRMIIKKEETGTLVTISYPLF